MKDENRKTFQRGGVDSFLHISDRYNLKNLYVFLIRLIHFRLFSPLANIRSIIIMSDGKSSWYLKHIIINDLQTRNKEYFICEKWFSLNKDDCRLTRILSACGEKQKREFKYLLKTQTEKKLTDSHLWFSIVTKPVQSSFTRLDRLTCCFVLLLISMLINILYYDIDRSKNLNGLQLGPFYFTPEQVMNDIIIYN